MKPGPQTRQHEDHPNGHVRYGSAPRRRIFSWLVGAISLMPVIAFGLSPYQFTVGQNIRVINSVSVRNAAAGTTVYGTQPAGAIGVIVSGPTRAQHPSNGKTYDWYQVNYDNSTLDGWSAALEIPFDDSSSREKYLGLAHVEVAAIAQQAGFHGFGLVAAIAIAQAESIGMNPSAVGDFNYCGVVGPASLGLWQINTASCANPSWNRQSLISTPVYCGQAAWSISKSQTDFHPWSTWFQVSGASVGDGNGVYKNYISAARAAVTTAIDPTVITSANNVPVRASASGFVRSSPGGGLVSGTNPRAVGDTGTIIDGATDTTYLFQVGGAGRYYFWWKVAWSDGQIGWSAEDFLERTSGSTNYTVSTSSSPSAGGTTSGSGTFAAGSSRTVTATANSGYSFVNWTESGSVVSTSSSYTFTLNSTRTLVANFTAVSYTITTISSPSGGGTTTGGGTYSAGSSRTVTATPNSGYSFVNWTESGSTVGNSASYTFTLNGNRTLVANFASPNYTIATSSSPSAGGTTTGGGTFSAGSSRTVTATANSGYSFVNWTESGSAVSSSTSYTFTLNSNRSLVASFSSGPNLPTVQTLDASSVTSSTAVLNGRVVSDGGSPVNDYFFSVWDDPANPVGFGSQYISISGNNFSLALQGFTSGVTYFYRAYAHNGSTADIGAGPGWGFGSVVSFVPPSALEADFNSDGKTDIIIQDSTGLAYIFYMNGQGDQLSGHWLNYHQTFGDWKIVGTGDFNSDGKTDIIIQDSTGLGYIFYMNGQGDQLDGHWLNYHQTFGDWKIRP
ncbi:MAG: hypothetical protein QOE26_217 [Verrucomicrobiota bacterium]